jgi:hypothetical protein
MASARHKARRGKEEPPAGPATPRVRKGPAASDEMAT